MRKIFFTVALSMVLSASTLAGDIPITGVQGCAPGLWYPESRTCVYEKATATVQVDKPQTTFIQDIFIKAVLFFKPSI